MRPVIVSFNRNSNIRIGGAQLLTFVRSLILLCLGIVPFAAAQTDMGYIQGTITDPSGAAVPGAQVVITWQSTGLLQTLVTNGAGFYASNPLQVGSYTVSVSMAGFASAAARNVIVDAATHVQLNLTLPVGSATTEITVADTPPVLDTTDAQVSTTIDLRSAQQLPINGRSVLALASFTPGVFSAVGPTDEGFAERGRNVSSIRIAGGPVGFNNVILDGVSNIQTWLGEVSANLKSDAVQEYRIMSGIIPAQFSYTSGGVINMVTRSGGKTVHGSAYEFFRNDALDAPQAYPSPAFGKQVTRFNNYGGTLGGPILRDKLFLFGNYDGYQYRTASPGYYTVPTAQEYQGDFSDLGQLVNGVCQPVNIFDADNVLNGQRQHFAYGGKANAINPARLDPVALAYAKMFYPLPNNSAGSYNACTHANNYIHAVPKKVTERQGLVRGDYKISDKDSVFARFVYFQNLNNNATAGFAPIYTDRNDNLRTLNGVLSYTRVFNPSLLNDARVGVLLTDFPYVAASYNQNIAGKIGLPNTTGLEFPTMNNGVQTPNITLGFRSCLTLEGIDDLTLQLSRHTVHLGGSMRFVEGFNVQGSSSRSGTFGFSAASTAAGNDTTVTTGTGSILAAYMLGQVTAATMEVDKGDAWRRTMYAGYVQDDWRVTPRLTVNAGMRWDFVSQAVEKHNGIENFDITQINPVNGYSGKVLYAGVDGNGRNFVAENYGNYGPRLGFAYSLTPGTIVRGGVAIYYPSVSNLAYNFASGNHNGFGSLTTSWTAPTAKGYDFALKNGFPTAYSGPLGVAGGQNAFLGQGAAYIQPKAKDPSSQIFTMTLSRELPQHVVLDASYIGNHGNHFNNWNSNMNTLPPQYYSLGTAALSASVPNPYAGKVPGSLGAPTITRANLLKPYPYMQSVTMFYWRNASYWSNYAELSVERRMEQGLQILGAYTFGKTTDNGIQGIPDQSGVGTPTARAPQNWLNPGADHTVDAIDVKHRLTISALYDLPLGRHHRLFSSGKGDRIFGGWQYNAIVTLESGRPVPLSGANNQLATRPNWNPNVGVKLLHPSKSTLYKTGFYPWFNPQAFVNPPDYTFGNVLPFDSRLRGPGTINVDMSVIKTTHITERTTAEFRIESYDAFNHHNLSMPSGSFVAGPPADSSNPYAEGGMNTSASFGQITGTNGMRNVQLAAKISF